MFSQAFGEENIIGAGKIIFIKTVKGETGGEQSQEYAHNFL
jgi:hypothetical protein